MAGCLMGSITGLWVYLPDTHSGYICSHSVTWVHLLLAAFISPRNCLKPEKVSVCCKIGVEIQWCYVFYGFAYFVFERISRLLSGLLYYEIMQKTVAKIFGAGVLLSTKYLLRLVTYGAMSEE